MKKAMILIVVFFIGLLIGGMGKNESKWKELKAVDDEVIGYAADVSGYCSTILDAVGKGELGTVTEQTKNVTDLTPKIISASEKRADILNELGY